MSDFLIHGVLWAVCLAALLASACTDVKSRIIPNRFAMAVAICGLALSIAARPHQLWAVGLGAAAVFFVFGVFAHYGLVGGGDVKLIAATAMLVPPERIPLLLLSIALAGGVLSFAYLAMGYVFRRVRFALPEPPEAGIADAEPARWVKSEYARIAAGSPVPYALAVLGGVGSYILGELPKCFSAISCSL